MSTYSFTLIPGVDNTLNVPSDVDLTSVDTIFLRVYSNEDLTPDSATGGFTFQTKTAHGAVFSVPGIAVTDLGGKFYRLELQDNQGKITGYSTTGELFPPDPEVGYAKQADVDDIRARLAALSGNTDEGDSVTRAHLWDVPEGGVVPDELKTPGMYYDTEHNVAGIGNCVLEVTTLPGVILQRATGIDSGKIATRRNYANTWSNWLVISPA